MSGRQLELPFDLEAHCNEQALHDRHVWYPATGGTMTCDGSRQAISVAELEHGVNHPDYYGGKDNPYEAIKVIEAWGLGFSLGNALKYISRAGKKDAAKELEDLKKARWYLDRQISNLEDQRAP